MNELLLSGGPVQVDFFYVYPWKLKDIVNPQKNYYAHLYIFFLKEEDIQLPKELTEGYELFDLIRVGAILGETFRQAVLDSLYAFTLEKFVFKNANFMLNDNILTSQHWEQIRQILAEENFIDLAKIKEEDEYNFANPKAAEFAAKRKKIKEEIEKYKRKKEVSLGFLINRFCAKSPNTNILSVWDYTFYQFKQQLDATVSIENYTFNMEALVNGNLDTRKQKIVHWTENN
jgi:hypothetical protein